MDKLFKSLVFDGSMSLSILDTTDMVNKAIKYHGLSPLAAATLGRTLTATTFMASGLKNEKDDISVTIAGDGVGGKVTVCGNGKLYMRGSIENPNAYLPLKSNGKLDVGGCVGKGRLTVVKSMGLKDPYSGSSELISGEIAEDFAYYFATSEQIPTAMALGVKIGKNGKCVGAGGVILQALPFASEEAINKAESIMGELSKVSTLIEEGGIEGVKDKFFKGIDGETYYPRYKCLCSDKKIVSVLRSLGEKETRKMVEEDGKIEVVCQFCNKKYVYFKEDVDTIFNQDVKRKNTKI